MALGPDRTARARVDTPVQPGADEPVDSDVPAAVLCARCGDADCPGCLHDETRSGVVAMVPWERPGAPAIARLWATARATTIDAEGFFATLPDGPLGPALQFAIVSELIASTAMGLLVLAPVALFAPEWLRHVAVDELATALRLVVVGVPSVAALLVVVHAVHGWALDRGARRVGAVRATRRALRFGLYSTGWDVVVGPLGAVVLLVREGLGVAARLGGFAVGLPGRSTRAFLRGCYRIDGDAAQSAARASYVVAGTATFVGALAVVAALVVVLFM